MVTRRICLLLFLLIFILSTAGCSTKEKIETVIPTSNAESILSKAFTIGDHDVSIMEVALPSDEAKKIQDINTKFKKSIQENMQWFNDYITKNSTQDGNLPWDEKFGISKEEYNELLSSVDRMKLIEKEQIKVSIVKDNNGKLTLKCTSGLRCLNEIQIDITNNSISTSNGQYKFSNKITASDDQTVTGPWNGGTWTLYFEELKDPKNIDVTKTYGQIDISVGQLEESNKTLVYYKERIIHQGQSYKGEEIIVFN